VLHHLTNLGGFFLGILQKLDVTVLDLSNCCLEMLTVLFGVTPPPMLRAMNAEHIAVLIRPTLGMGLMFVVSCQ